MKVKILRQIKEHILASMWDYSFTPVTGFSRSPAVFLNLSVSVSVRELQFPWRSSAFTMNILVLVLLKKVFAFRKKKLSSLILSTFAIFREFELFPQSLTPKVVLECLLKTASVFWKIRNEASHIIHLTSWSILKMFYFFFFLDAKVVPGCNQMIASL